MSGRVYGGPIDTGHCKPSEPVNSSQVVAIPNLSPIFNLSARRASQNPVSASDRRSICCTKIEVLRHIYPKIGMVSGFGSTGPPLTGSPDHHPHLQLVLGANMLILLCDVDVMHFYHPNLLRYIS